jgi:hypothetical protein
MRKCHPCSCIYKCGKNLLLSDARETHVRPRAPGTALWQPTHQVRHTDYDLVVLSRLHVKEWRVKQTTPLYVLARSQLGTHRTSTSTIRRSMQPRSTAEFDRRNRLTTSDIPRNVCTGRHQRACTVRACTKRTTQHTYACLSVHAQVSHLYSNTPPHSACQVPHYAVRHIPSYQRRSQTSPFLGPW